MLFAVVFGRPPLGRFFDGLERIRWEVLVSFLLENRLLYNIVLAPLKLNKSFKKYHIEVLR